MFNPMILNGQCGLFEGSSQYERFNKIFVGIVKSSEHRAKFLELGIPPEDFGTHSIRKGALIYFHTASTGIATSCAYWDFTAYNPDPNLCNETALDDWIKARTPTEVQYNENAFSVFKRCLAAVVYHRKYLDDNVHPESVIRRSIFISDPFPFPNFVKRR